MKGFSIALVLLSLGSTAAMAAPCSDLAKAGGYWDVEETNQAVVSEWCPADGAVLKKVDADTGVETFNVTVRCPESEPFLTEVKIQHFAKSDQADERCEKLGTRYLYPVGGAEEFSRASQI